VLKTNILEEGLLSAMLLLKQQQELTSQVELMMKIPVHL
jgi:hypothetical protein